jgi:hypothetical protein
MTKDDRLHNGNRCDNSSTRAPVNPIGSNDWSASQIQSILSFHLSITIVFIMCLLGVSHPLWLPEKEVTFPKVPLLQEFAVLSNWWDSAFLVGLLAGLSTAFMTGLVTYCPGYRRINGSQGKSRRCVLNRAQRLQRIGLWSVLVFGVGLVLLNQHRLQAWFYLLMLMVVAWNLRDYLTQLRWLQWLIISVYAYSALGKLDYEFLHTVGQDFFSAIATAVGLDASNWSRTDRLFFAGLMPLTELSLAIGLLSHRSRRAVGLIAALFHLMLAWVLGWQLQHSWGVVIWNIQFAVQAVLLFFCPVVQQDRKCSMVFEQVASKMVLALAMLMPLAERHGYWDHWPSWALYAPHTSRSKVWVAETAVDRLPSRLRELIEGAPSDMMQGREVPLDKWSLSALNVPIYPQSRFQLGIARYLAEQVEASHGIRVELWDSASRLDGHRLIQRLDGRQQIEQAADNYWLGSRPR